MARWKAPQKAKRDLNEPEIFEVLEAFGLTVEPTDKPADAVVGYLGQTYLVEVKNGPKAPLTTYQKGFIERWKGQYVILCSAAEAEEWAALVRKSGDAGVPFRGQINADGVPAK